jgi:hypothetical protein
MPRLSISLPVFSDRNARADSVGAKSMQMRIEIAARPPAPGERNAASLRIFEFLGASILAVVIMNISGQKSVNLTE